MKMHHETKAKSIETVSVKLDSNRNMRSRSQEGMRKIWIARTVRDSLHEDHDLALLHHVIDVLELCVGRQPSQALHKSSAKNHGLQMGELAENSEIGKFLCGATRVRIQARRIGKYGIVMTPKIYY